MRQSILFIILVIITAPSCTSQNSSKNESFNGKWFIEFKSNDIGVVRSFLNFEFQDTSFVAYSRKGADKAILSSWKSFLGRTFTKDFKNGSLINIENGKVKCQRDTLVLNGIFRSALGSYYFKGKIIKGILDVKLTNRKNEVRGEISGSKAIPPFTKITIFNKNLLTTKNYLAFEKDIRAVAKNMHDDLEMEFAFFYFAKDLPFSHYSLIRLSEDKVKAESTLKNQITIEEKTPETLYMKIKSFSGKASEMDSAFAMINKKNYKTLIVDLRNNSGGTIEAGMKFATNVASSEFYGGVFLTQKWFNETNIPPVIADYNKLPLFSKANFDLIIEGIHNEKGLCLKVIPEAITFKGNLFILTNSKTASTCEPIVYGLKQYKRATIVGEKTAGAMLNGEFFKITDNYSIVIPTADYYTSDGFRIDQQGVTPNIITKQELALEFVLKNLVK
jgi:hypothetical protein